MILLLNSNEFFKFINVLSEGFPTLDSFLFIFDKLISFNKDKLEITSLKKFGLNIYKKNKSNLNTLNKLNFGFIYEFELSDNEGDAFIIFGTDDFPKININFEATDNSS